MMKAFDVLRLVQIAEAQQGRGPMSSSAILAANDARTLYAASRFGPAITRARRSLEYSLGVLHPIFVSIFGATS